MCDMLYRVHVRVVLWLGQAILQVFGKTLVCRDLSVASRFAEEYNLNCVRCSMTRANSSTGKDRMGSQTMPMPPSLFPEALHPHTFLASHSDHAAPD